MKFFFVNIIIGLVIVMAAVYAGIFFRHQNQKGLAAVVLNSQKENNEFSSEKINPQEILLLVRRINQQIGEFNVQKQIPIFLKNDPTPTSRNGASLQQQDSESKFLEVDTLSAQAVNSIKKLPENGEYGTQVAQSPSLKILIDERSSLLTTLAKMDANLFFSAQLKDETIKKIPQSFVLGIEKPVTLTGKIDVVHYDDFKDSKNSYFRYFLKAGNEKLELYVTSPLYTTSGETFTIEGLRIGNVLVAHIEGIEHIVPPVNPYSPREEPDSVGEQRTLVLLLDFRDSHPINISPNAIHNILFDGKFNNFYREQSYNKINFSGDVLGWYPFPRNGNHSSYVDIPEIEEFITDNTIDLSSYDRLFVVTSDTYGGLGTVGKVSLTTQGTEHLVSIGWVGLSSILELSQSYNGPLGPYVLSNFESVFSHEAGHNLGVMHANGLDCGTQRLRGNCDHVEYGNSFDVMGTGVRATHFNAFYKELLGWIEPQNKIAITQSGRYTLDALEAGVMAGNINISKNFATIQRENSTVIPFYLEHRNGTGFDIGMTQGSLFDTFYNLQGLFVNKIVRSSPVNQFPHLLDMNPTAQDWNTDLSRATLNYGQVFVDVNNGITIGPFIQAATSSITFDVDVKQPECQRGTPIFDPILYHSSTLTVGQDGFITLFFDNGDSVVCSESKFKVESSIPAAWLPAYPPEIPIIPNDNDTGTVSQEIYFSLPENVPPGIYPVTVSVINKTTGYRRDRQVTIRVTTAPIIFSIDPTVGRVGSEVRILGSDFSDNPIVWLDHGDGYAQLVPTFSSYQIIDFTIPSRISDYVCSGECDHPTPLGDYTVLIKTQEGVLSNPVSFEVVQ